MLETTKQIFIANLKRLRKNRYTQEKLSEKIGLSLRGYQKYEQGESEPNFEMIGKIAAALGCDASELLKAENAEPYDQFGASIPDVIALLGAWEKAPRSARAKAMRSLASQDQLQTTEELLQEAEAAARELTGAQSHPRAKSD